MRRLHDEEVSISGPMFEDLRTQTDEVLKTMLDNMLENDEPDGETNIRIKAKIRFDEVVEDGARRCVRVPVFETDVSTVLKQVTRQKNSIGGNYELVFDADEGKHFRRVIGGEQTSLFDPEILEGELETAQREIAREIARREGQISVARLRAAIPKLGNYAAAVILDDLEAAGWITEDGTFTDAVRQASLFGAGA